MTIAYWCVLAMIIYPYIFTILAKTQPNYNNHDPRTYLSTLTGWRKRANGVQLNSFETTPAFVAAVIIAHLTGASQHIIDLLAVIYVVVRILYGICYLADASSLRTLCWFVGMFCIIAMFFIK